VTQRLVEYVQQTLWSAVSLRSLSASVGALPKTITELLKILANDVRQLVAIPAELGIHELQVNKRRHLILSNLTLGTVVDFVPCSDKQIDLLSHRLTSFNNREPVQVVTVPAAQEVVREATNKCPSARVTLSLASIHVLLARAVSNLGGQESRKGRTGSISRKEAELLACRRKIDLSNKDNERLEAGLRENNKFWMLFDAKENLLNQWENTDGSAWLNIFRKWILELPSQSQPAFHGLLTLLSDAKMLRVILSVESALPFVDTNLNVLKGLLSKPGRSFSPEMLAALLLASPEMTVRLERRFSSKGAGHFWVEELSDFVGKGPPTTAGTSLANLVNALTVSWDSSSKIAGTPQNLWD
jgi:hypothetical protein